MRGKCEKIINPISVDKIKNIVLSEYEVTQGELVKKSRKSKPTMARHVLAHCLWRYSKLDQSQIAKIIKRDRTSVIHGIQEVEAQCRFYPEVRQHIISIESKIDT